MKKTIQILTIIILSAIMILIVISVFNPFNLRTKMIGSIINSYLSNNIENYSPINNAPSNSTEEQSNVSHPLLNEAQKETFREFRS